MPVDTRTCLPKDSSFDIQTRMTGKMLGMNMGYQKPAQLTMPSAFTQSGLATKSDTTPEPRYMKVCAASFDDFVGLQSSPTTNGLITKSTVLALPSENGHSLRVDNPLTFRTLRGDGLSRMAVMKGDLIDLLAVKFNAQEIYNEAYNSIRMAGAMDVQRNTIPLSRPPTAWDDAYPMHSYNTAQKGLPHANTAFLTRLDKQELEKTMNEMARRELEARATTAPPYEQYHHHNPLENGGSGYSHSNGTQGLRAKKAYGKHNTQKPHVYNGPLNGNGYDHLHSGEDQLQSSSECTVNLDISVQAKEKGKVSPKSSKSNYPSKSLHTNGYEDTPRRRREARQPLETESSGTEQRYSAKQKRKSLENLQRRSQEPSLNLLVEPIAIHSTSDLSTLSDTVLSDPKRDVQNSKERVKNTSNRGKPLLTNTKERKERQLEARGSHPSKSTICSGENNDKTINRAKDDGRNLIQEQKRAQPNVTHGLPKETSSIPKPIESVKLPTTTRRTSPSPTKLDRERLGSEPRPTLETERNLSESKESHINLGSSLRGIRDGQAMEYSNEWLQKSVKENPNPAQSSLPASRESRSRRSSAELEYRSTPTFNLSSSLKKRSEKRSRGLPSREISPDAYRESIEQSLQRYKTRNLYIDVDMEAMDSDEYNESTKWNKSVVKKVLTGSNTTVNDTSVASTSELSLGSVVRKSLHKSSEDDGGRAVKRRLGQKQDWSQGSRSNSASSDNSVKISPGRMSISDLEPVRSRDTITDESFSRKRSDSEKSACEKCGEYLDHPIYHRRYNVHGELVPCKSLTQFTSATSFTKTTSDITSTHLDMTSFDEEDSEFLDKDKDIDEATVTEMGGSEFTSGNTTTDLARSEPDLREPSTSDGASTIMSRFASRRHKQNHYTCSLCHKYAYTVY